MVRRINLLSGPGAGKSTTAAMIFSRLKNRSIKDRTNNKIELVQEYVKEWAYEGVKPRGFDQMYLCASQMRREEIPLRAGVDLIVTDSPLILQCMYADKHGVPGTEHLYGMCREFEAVYPSLNIFLDRGFRAYVAHGRYETDDQAREMDQYIISCMKYQSMPFKSFMYDDVDAMVDYILENTNE